MSDREVNIPLLRKAVEWAEAEAAKPEGCLWIQEWWYTPPKSFEGLHRSIRKRYGLTDDCGTAYCVAGYVCEVSGVNPATSDVAIRAAELLGTTYFDDETEEYGPAERLFAATNTIEDVRRIAEEIAGERL